MDKMTDSRAVEVLAAHNAWRRGGDGPATDPTTLGLALDHAIARLREPAVVPALIVDHIGNTHSWPLMNLPSGTRLFTTPQPPAEAQAQGGGEAVVLAPHFRGYAHLGTGDYMLLHSREDDPAELCIVPATEQERAGTTVGDLRDDAPDEVPAERIAVRLRFENVEGLNALEQQLRLLRDVHFPDTAPPSAPVGVEGLDTAAVEAGHITFESMKQCADSWLAVVDALNTAAPGWCEKKGAGRECAVAAIAALAQQPAAPIATVGEVYIRLNGIGEGGPYPVVNGVCVLPQSVAENLVASAVGQQMKRELLAQWASYKQPAAPQQPAAVFRNYGCAEADFVAHAANACTACGGSGHKADQQPAACVGEEIMVNAAHDVYTLPLQPSGLLSGPRFVVHVPGPEQPAAVDGADARDAKIDALLRDQEEGK